MLFLHEKYYAWIILLIHAGTSGLQLLEVKIPSRKLLTASAVLRCLYELGPNTTLYAIKWYKDGSEFYRYHPADTPHAQIFSLPGVIVDVQMSDEYQVVLKGVTHSSSGIYHCEISSEAPSFQTVSGESLMTITEVPEESPRITGLKNTYNEGEWLHVNCTSKLKRATVLNWYINNEKAHERCVKLIRQETKAPEPLERYILMLSFKVTTKIFPGRVLSLRCVAKLGNRHWQHQRWALLSTITSTYVPVKPFSGGPSNKVGDVHYLCWCFNGVSMIYYFIWYKILFK